MDRRKNKGSAAIEAIFGVTMFLFVSLLMFHMLHLKAVKSSIYNAAVEAAEYAAEYAYLTGWAAEKLTGDGKDGAGSAVDSAVLFGLAEEKLLSSLEEPEVIDRYVRGGRAGILLLGSSFPDDDGDIHLRVNYTVRISTPFLPDLECHVSEEIRQKPYLGHEGSDGTGNDGTDPYVYVTDNRDVYHKNRGCTHLVLTIYPESRMEAEKRLRPCEFCGKDAGETVLVCMEGETYHSDPACRALKRTVYRKRLSEVGGLSPCSRCGK